MRREYQSKKAKAYVLPETVYRQALWAIKDLNRVKEELDKAVEEIDNIQSPDLFKEHSRIGSYSDTTEMKASRIIKLTNRIENIENAFFYIPEKYRHGIKEKLVDGGDFGDQFHPNTWKKWQQVFIYHVAKNLEIF